MQERSRRIGSMTSEQLGVENQLCVEVFLSLEKMNHQFQPSSTISY